MAIHVTIQKILLLYYIRYGLIDLRIAVLTDFIDTF
jgi:hypothetical protein